MGKGIVNPLAAILSGWMLLDHLGQSAASEAVERAVAAVLAEGRFRTPDLGAQAARKRSQRQWWRRSRGEA